MQIKSKEFPKSSCKFFNTTSSILFLILGHLIKKSGVGGSLSVKCKIRISNYTYATNYSSFEKYFNRISNYLPRAVNK
jgi:hypothetical protein